MANFPVIHFDLGEIEEGQKTNIFFNYEGDLNLVGSNPIEPSCGCSTPVLDRERKTLKIVYVAPILGIHPQTKKKIDRQDTTKTVKINEITGQQTLSFRSVTIPKLSS